MANSRILIVEDERRIARFLQIELEHEGFETALEDNGKRAYERIIQEKYDLVLLDVMLPAMDGMEICRRVREIMDIPIIMLTARDDVEDKVTGLDLGADDYITKPFAIEELMARIRNVMRKRPANHNKVNDRLQVGNLVMYPTKFEITVNGEEVQLTKRQFEFLEFLIRHRGTVVTRNQILQEIWGYDYTGDTNVVDVYVRYIRSKIDDKFNHKYIHTIRGVGYVVKD